MSPTEAARALGVAPAPGSKPTPPAPASAPGTKKAKEGSEEGILAEWPPGTRIDRYTLEEAIGQGGMSTVYRAFDPTTNRYVAMKVMVGGASETMRQRFLREIEVQANLRHPNLMPVFDRGEHLGRPFFTMELLYRPFTLTEVVEMARDGRIARYATLRPLEDIATLVRDVLVPVCEGLHVANVENGVVHRDMKPDNVLVDSRTLRPYVIDFGICHVLERHGRRGGPVLAPTAEDAGILGTPRFLAPEQARGAVHERTDIWGLGAILHFCLSGEPPIAAASPISRADLRRRIDALREAERSARAQGDETRADLCADKLARLEDAGLRTLDDLFQDAREGVYTSLPSDAPTALAAIVRKAMAPKTAERYVNARSLAADLEAWLKGSRTRARAEEGPSAASVVEGAQKAVRRHLRTAVLLVVAAGAGVLAGSGLSGGTTVLGGEDARAEELRAYADLLEASAEKAAQSASRMTTAEGVAAYDLLKAQADAVRSRLAALTTARAGNVAQRIARVEGRFTPARVAVEAPTNLPEILVEDVIRGGEGVRVKPGDLALRPGEYRLKIGPDAAIVIPLVVPFHLLEAGRTGDREPAKVVVRIPSGPEAAPEGMVLVVPTSDRVEYRGAPFSAPMVAPPAVAPFWMDRTEVTNRRWLAFLEALTDDERKTCAGAEEFTTDTERPKHFALNDGAEDLPVVGITPENAVRFARWRAEKEGGRVRLPTEAEWAVAAGVVLGYSLPGGVPGEPSDGDLTGALVPVQRERDRDVSPYGVRGLLGNAREIVTEIRPDSSTGFLAKGAGIGDLPADAAIRLVRPFASDARNARTGFRCVREVK